MAEDALSSPILWTAFFSRMSAPFSKTSWDERVFCARYVASWSSAAWTLIVNRFQHLFPHMTRRCRDTIHIDELVLTLTLDDDEQAVLLSLCLTHDVSRAARSDDLTHSINYAAVYTTLIATLSKTPFTSLEALVDRVYETLFGSHPDVDEAGLVVTLRDASPRFTIETTRKRGQTSMNPCKSVINGLAFDTIIGVNPPERIKEQLVVFDVTINGQQQGEPFPFVALSASIRRVCTIPFLSSRQCANARMDYRHSPPRRTSPWRHSPQPSHNTFSGTQKTQTTR